ncbi:hypothetical protein K2Z83_07285 [Oscillochloris sp. ZM17-4]|uniref:hypothetical protein n=1 Tax=Oscillochloris sp. ZM17-4 TaxID=2866714 RepID=UPI001C73C11A|nr:hypothetical protein [Oscillochloris sp. ZM17-4]MBX0327480.1 hypothetical protein [Oscillochloris sp. ZM17-4]
MQTDYTDQDTERARQAERSSAGVQTQQLQMPSGAGYAPAGQIGAAPAQRANPLALGMIGLGVLLLLSRGATAPMELTGGMVLLTISSCFFFFGLWKRLYGLIIPACILAGLSVGVTFANLTAGVSVLWGLSLGFLGVFALGRGLFGKRTQWPIYPAVPLFAVGLIVAAANLPSILGLGMIWGPLLLIGAGLYLGWFRR